MIARHKFSVVSWTSLSSRLNPASRLNPEFLTAFTVTMMIWLFQSNGGIPRAVYGLPTFRKAHWLKQRLMVVLFHCVTQVERS